VRVSEQGRSGVEMRQLRLFPKKPATRRALVQCTRCGKRVTLRNDVTVNHHTCPHGWTCVPPSSALARRKEIRKPCWVCREAKELGVWQRDDGQPHSNE
jgi:hypothetical protein